MRLLAIAVLCAFCCACAGEDMLTGDRRDVGVVTMVFTVTPAKVQAGQPVRFRIRVSNNGGKTEHLATPTSQVYDFWAKKGTRTVWRWSTDQAFLQTLTTTDLPTQTTKVFTELWRPQSTGRFTVYGEIKADGFEGPMKGSILVQ